LIVAAKKTYPKWGPRKLRALLADRYPHASGRARVE